MFPSVVSTREGLVLNGVVPLEHMRDYMPSMQRLIEKVGLQNCLEQYHCVEFLPEISKDRAGQDPTAEARAFLTAYARKRKYFLRLGEPDTHRGAIRALRDITTGALLYCEPPPDSRQAKPIASSSSSCPKKTVHLTELDEVDENMNSLFLEMQMESKRDELQMGRMTKRKQRMMRKDLMKNKQGISADGYVSGLRPEQTMAKYKVMAANLAATDLVDNTPSENDEH